MSIHEISSPDPGSYRDLGLSREDLLWFWETMLKIRRFEERVQHLFLVEKKLVGPSHLYIGQEAVAAGVMKALRDDDWIVSTYRGHGHAIARGVPLKFLMAELFGKETGTCRGLGGSMHAAMYPEKGIVYATAIVGSGIPIAAGIGLAFRYRGTDRVSVVFFGDGAVNTGAFHEGVNIAALWRLPTVLVCENNLYAMGTRVDRAVAGGSIVRRVLAYGIDGYVVDGNDPVAVFIATSRAVAKARSGGGPSLIEARTYRLVGHGVYDPGTRYRSREEVEEWKRRDPIDRFRRVLIDHGFAKSEELEEIDRRIKKEVDEAVDFAEKSRYLDFDELFKLVYA